MSSDAPAPPIGYPNYPPPPRRIGVGRVFFWIVLLASLGLNMLVCCGLAFILAGGVATDSLPLTQRTLSGPASASNKIAVIRVAGTIVDEASGTGDFKYFRKQIEDAASENDVKAIVLRVESPGGTISASDDLLNRLIQLRDGTTPKYKDKTFAKPIVVSMGPVAASGGYYISMAAVKDQPEQKKIFADRTCITGSIGVYASLPNIKELGDKVGFKMELIKAGDVKASGSMFHEMTPAERQPWQEMIASSYQRFIEVVETGRPALKGKMTEELFPPRPVPIFDDKGNPTDKPGGTYTRRRADGGIFTPQQALEYGLIDAIGTLHDAATEVATQAKVTDYRLIEYVKPTSIWGDLPLISARAPTEAELLSRINFEPSLWYLLPSAEVTARTTGR
jgi:protease-4